MTVGLTCCTVSSPDPWAIFKAKRGRWTLAFSRINVGVFGLDTGRYFLGGRKPSRRAVEEKSPVYEPDDGNCCPSSFIYHYTAWKGKRFVYGVR